NEDDNFDLEADLRKIKYFLNQDPSIEFDIEIINHILEKFTDEPALNYSPPPKDDDDDLFDLKSDNDEWKKLFDSNLPEESSESSNIATLSSSPFGNKDKEMDTQETDQNKAKKRQNQTQSGKDQKRQSKSKPEVKSQSPWLTKVNPRKVKVNPGKAEAEK
nr:hypothetical protein [Tanacetum cinerariifolium]